MVSDNMGLRVIVNTNDNAFMDELEGALNDLEEDILLVHNENIEGNDTEVCIESECNKQCVSEPTLENIKRSIEGAKCPVSGDKSVSEKGEVEENFDGNGSSD